jgi:predicted LPLAT superfamily acyltransferase
MSKAVWAKAKEFGAGQFRLRFLFGVYCLFGRKALKIAVFPIALAALIFRKSAQDASLDYFEKLNSFTERPEHRPTALNALRHIYSFAASLVDKLGAWTGSITESDVEYKNELAVARFFENLRMGKGVFILCSHLGNIELLRAMATSRPEALKVNAFIETAQTQEFNDFIAQVNPDAAINLFPVQDIGIETAFLIKTKLEGGEVVVMAADREPGMNERSGAPLPFLGGTALFPKGAFRFLKLMECDFCFLFICQNSKGKYDVHVDFFDAERARMPEEAMKAFAARLEKLLLQYPYQWYNFFKFWH